MKKRRSRKDRTAEVRKHVFKHVKTEAVAKTTTAKNEPAATPADPTLGFIKRDLRLFIFLSTAILLLIFIFFVLTKQLDIKIFNATL